MAYSHPIIGPLYQTESWLYAMNMDAHPTLKRLLEAFIFAALAGGVGYAVTSWLAPEYVSAGIVAAIVAAIAGIASIVPNSLLPDMRDPDSDPWRPPKVSYYSAAYRVWNDEGFRSDEYRPEDGHSLLEVRDSDD